MNLYHLPTFEGGTADLKMEEMPPRQRKRRRKLSKVLQKKDGKEDANWRLEDASEKKMPEKRVALHQANDPRSEKVETALAFHPFLWSCSRLLLLDSPAFPIEQGHKERDSQYPIASLLGRPVLF
ncbi:hypothetical protein AVEN_84926-1 [Araneus ventricosus]|uniref:Uncharacterized protein n=1 Tax=Araneus ventricosus TaxID=182803 RepID=A0A4Y2C0U3_ARAVE|nr:hypothetical protein AVEN_84926-1 [Araneus ventricosus]